MELQYLAINLFYLLLFLFIFISKDAFIYFIIISILISKDYNIQDWKKAHRKSLYFPLHLTFNGTNIKSFSIYLVIYVHLFLFFVEELILFFVNKILNRWSCYLIHSDYEIIIIKCKLLILQLWDQDIAPLKRSLSSNSRRLSRISQLALVNYFSFYFVARNVKFTDYYRFLYNKI